MDAISRLSRWEGLVPTYDTILADTYDAVTLIRLNRPQALNALNGQVLADLIAAFAAYDADPGQRCAVLTGSDKAFAAGADIKEMAELSFADVFSADFFAAWGKFAATRTPTIAAVAGYALGGGCELAMMCDLLIAADTVGRAAFATFFIWSLLNGHSAVVVAFLIPEVSWLIAQAVGVRKALNNDRDGVPVPALVAA